MRVAAEQHGLAHALREEIVFALRHDAYKPGEILARPVTGGTTLNQGLTFERSQRSERNADQRRLAAAVRAEDGVELSRRNRQRNSSQCVLCCARIAIADALKTE